MVSAEEGKANVDYAEFEVSRLRCIIGNNQALGDHRERYNGVFSMHSPDQEETPFVPFYAGLNLEHYFDGRARHPDGTILFEPRTAPLEFKRLGDSSAELYQPTTPYFGVESWTRFALKEPYYIDLSFRCIAHKDDLASGFLGVFWASYINGPLNKSMHFLAAGSDLEKPVWRQFCTQSHDRDSTVLHEADQTELVHEEGAPILWQSFSQLRYSAPFFYGRFRNMVLIYIFEPGPNIRFSHSPSGGGRNANEDDTNPAWDFQLIVPDYEAGREYGLQMRLVYKPWAGRTDVLAEVRKYLASR